MILSAAEIYEVYARLRDERGVTDYAVAKACGIGRSTFADWKAGRSIPRTEKLAKIADFFGVSLEYLCNGKEPETDAVDPKDRELFSLYQKATPEQKAMAIKLFRALIGGDGNE